MNGAVSFLTQRGFGIGPLLIGGQETGGGIRWLWPRKPGSGNHGMASQLADVVLNRRARQRDSGNLAVSDRAGAELARLRILDVLRLVENDSRP